MNLLYISQDGWSPSGVVTYGRMVLDYCQGSRLLLLNADPDLRPNGWPESRIDIVAGANSHDPSAVAAAIRKAMAPGERNVIFPNTGDTPWEATRQLLTESSESSREMVRVLGVVHSDTGTQYALAERFLPIAPTWIGVSRKCADELRRRFGSAGGRVFELPYPIELDAAVPRKRGEGPLRLAYVGRLDEEQKRISRLCDVFARLAAAGVDFVATIVGDGPDRESFRDSLESLGEGAADRVSMAGPLAPDRVRLVWREHDICLLTSAYEGTPLALLEAMAAGACPVVMAVESGLPELLEDGVNGRICAQGDVDGMANALAELANDRNQVARLGAAARDTVARRFSPQEHFRKLGRIIDELWSCDPPDPDRVLEDPVRSAVMRLVAELKQAGQPVAVFGAGMFGRKLVDACIEHGVTVVALVDSNPAMVGWRFRNLVCTPPRQLAEINARVVAVGSMQFVPEISNAVRELYETRSLAVPRIVSVV